MILEQLLKTLTFILHLKKRRNISIPLRLCWYSMQTFAIEPKFKEYKVSIVNVDFEKPYSILFVMGPFASIDAVIDSPSVL